MCHQLAMLCDFVHQQPGTASLSDVIRIACSSCDKTEVCAYVTSNEFDEGKKHAIEISSESNRPRPAQEQI